MSDQPETMLEYHFRKLARVMVTGLLLLMSGVFVSTSGLLMWAEHPLGFAFAVGALLMLSAAHATTTDGRARSVMNRVFRTELSDLERPDVRSTEVFADD